MNYYITNIPRITYLFFEFVICNCQKMLNIIYKILIHKNASFMLIFLIGFILGIVIFLNLRGAHFYQHWFSPAINYACSGNFKNIPENAYSSTLKDFLDFRKNKTYFNCKDIDWSNFNDIAFTEYQYSLRHLIFLAGLIWSIVGVKWSALCSVAGLFVGISAISLFGLFNLILSRRRAFICSIIALGCPVFVNYIIHLRDFSKTPFI